MTTSRWTRHTLPEPPSRPTWLGEESYAELIRAHELASRALTVTEAAERRVQALRVEADTATAVYAKRLEELMQPTLDDAST